MKKGWFFQSIGQFAFLFLVITLICSCLYAQKSLASAEKSSIGSYEQAYTESFFPEGTYDSDIPAPENVLGFPIGSKPCHYEEALSYFQVLAESSPLAKLKEYGRTHEGRILYYLI